MMTKTETHVTPEPQPEVAGFDYRPTDGSILIWELTVTGHEDQPEGEDLLADDGFGLADVEITIDAHVDAYAENVDASITRIRSGQFWREFEWDDGAIHLYRWSHRIFDGRCKKCLRPGWAATFMIHDDLWNSSGLAGRPCFLCMEDALGRKLAPSDFKLDVPANINCADPELRERMMFGEALDADPDDDDREQADDDSGSDAGDDADAPHPTIGDMVDGDTAWVYPGVLHLDEYGSYWLDSEQPAFDSPRPSTVQLDRNNDEFRIGHAPNIEAFNAFYDKKRLVHGTGVTVANVVRGQ